jgi:hypothetical protein
MAKSLIASVLDGSDRRSIGRVDEVVRLVLNAPRRFPELIKCLSDENPVVRMRAADAAEKVSARKPRLLDRHKGELLGLLSEADEIELRWHLAAMVPRLRLTPPEHRRAVTAFYRYLNDRSSIVKTFALQGSRIFDETTLPCAAACGSSWKMLCDPGRRRRGRVPASC